MKKEKIRFVVVAVDAADDDNYDVDDDGRSNSETAVSPNGKPEP